MAGVSRRAGIAAFVAALSAAAASAQPAPMPQQVAPENVWPASAATVDYGALQKLPDWRGIWQPLPGSGVAAPGAVPQLIGAYKAHYDEIQGLIRKNDAESLLRVERRSSACEPPGVPGIMIQPYNIEFLFTPGRVTIVQEAFMQVRRVFTDGRPLPEDPDPTYNGSSVGRWEGDTLVATTVGLREGGTMARWGITHSDKVKLTERIHLDPNDNDVLVVDNLFEDPKALTAPFRTTSRFRRARGFDQIEFVCAQNDRNPINSAGDVEFIGVAK